MTATLSMQMFGQQLREEGIARRRSEAAKKAWRTRRRLAKVTPAMRKVLDALARYPRLRLSLPMVGRMRCSLHWSTVNENGTEGPVPSGVPRHVGYGTFRAMENRGWFDRAGRRCTGTSCSADGITQATWDIDHVISDKGRKALASTS